MALNYLNLKPRVDFEMLKETIRHLPEVLDDGCTSDEYIDNIMLFFHLLSIKPSFAIKAHKELNKLNK